MTVKRKLGPGLSVDEARSDVRSLFHWLSAVEPRLLVVSAWAFQDRCSLSFWDAVILAAAQSPGGDLRLRETQIRRAPFTAP